MLSDTAVKKLLNEFIGIEAQAKDTVARCCQARALLENFYSPAPSGGKNPLSHKQRNDIIEKRRTNISKANKRNK